MPTLQRGQRMALSTVTSGQRLTLRTQLSGLQAPDLSLFGLDESRQLSDDRYFIFYNQLESPEGALRLDLASQTFQINLERVPLGIYRLLLAATTDNQTFRALKRATVCLEDGQGRGVQFEVQGDLFENEQAVMLLELYRHQGQWRVMGVGQGFSGGLQALLESVGGQVVSEPQPSALPPQLPAQRVAPLPALTWEPLDSAPQAAQGRPGVCQSCGKSPSFFNRLNTQGHCKECARLVQEGLRRFRVRFLAASADGIMELREWHDLQQTVYEAQLDAPLALEFVRPDALHLLERTLTLARADGQISAQDVENFNRLARLLRVPDPLLTKLREDLNDLRGATLIREGHLPTITSTLLLEAGEVAHLEVPAQFRHVTATRARDIPGRLVVTNRQVHFVSPEGGWNVQYS
jgi:stress response protein SCP2